MIPPSRVPHLLDFPALDECLLALLGGSQARVLGRRLGTLTLMHRELLRMAGSPLVVGGALRLTDLDLAVQVCSRRPQAAVRWLLRRRGGWWVRLRMALLAVRFGWRLPRQVERLRHWLDSQESAPAMLVREREPQPGEVSLRRDAPPVLDLWTRLVEAGFDSEAVLLQWPSGLVRWVFETLISRDGGRKFQTEEDLAMIEEARRMKEVTEPELRPEAEVIEQMRRLMREMKPSR